VELTMTTAKIVLCVAAGVAQALVVALACHAVHLDAHGFALLPLAAGAGVFLYMRQNFNRGAS